ncbi:MAG: EamA family transporter [Thermomicrobiales bacterium]
MRRASAARTAAPCRVDSPCRYQRAIAVAESAVVTCTPLITALLDRLFLGEQLGVAQIVGIVIVLSGVALV